MANEKQIIDGLVAALKGVIAVADRKTVEFDNARAALHAAEQAAPEATENEILMAADLKTLLDAAQAWKHCPSTHCERGQECRSPSQCCSLKTVAAGLSAPAHGTPTRMLREPSKEAILRARRLADRGHAIDEILKDAFAFDTPPPTGAPEGQAELSCGELLRGRDHFIVSMGLWPVFVASIPNKLPAPSTPTGAPREPRDWKLVPVEPDAVMLADAAEAMADELVYDNQISEIYRVMVAAAPPAPAGDGWIDWAVGRWNAEVANRPLRNVHRRTLDDTWRQVIRRAGGNPDKLLGLCHDDLLTTLAVKRPARPGDGEKA